MTTRTVLISDAQYTNAHTGVQTSSQVYHLPGYGCIDDSDYKVEVAERVALAFGRRLCGICDNKTKTALFRHEVEAALTTAGWPPLNELSGLLPEGLEMRLYHHRGRGSNARRVWSSNDPRNHQ